MKNIQKAFLALLGLFLPLAILANGGEAAAGMFAGLIGLFIFMIYFVFIGGFIILGVLGTILWIWMLVDCAKREFKNENDKLLWILVIVLASTVGAIVYYFVVKRELDKKTKNAVPTGRQEKRKTKKGKGRKKSKKEK